MSATTPKLVDGIPWWLKQLAITTGLRPGSAGSTQGLQAILRPQPLPPTKLPPPSTVKLSRNNPAISIPTNITFLSPSETSAFLKGDSDGYVSRMTRLDFVARGMPPDVYLSAISEAAMRTSTSPSEQQKVIECAQLADAFFYNCVKTPINGITVARMPWKFGFVEGKIYEYGLPHTRADIIFIPLDILGDSVKELTRTLIHEKVHIYQRANVEAIEGWIAENYYEAFDKIGNRGMDSEIRSNPDIGDWYYMKCEDASPYSIPGDSEAKASELMQKRKAWLLEKCKPMAAFYENKSKDPEGNEVPSDPTNITQVKEGSGGKHEHPYEAMAYEIADRYTGESCKPK